VLRRLNPLRRLRSATPRGASAIGIDSCAEVKALLSQRLVMCDAQRMGGAVCRPLTAVAVAIERNRSVNDPASRPASCPRGGPRVVHAPVPGGKLSTEIVGGSSGEMARGCVVFASLFASPRRSGFPRSKPASDRAVYGYAAPLFAPVISLNSPAILSASHVAIRAHSFIASLRKCHRATAPNVWPHLSERWAR
jgi:hypothetical protein